MTKLSCSEAALQLLKAAKMKMHDALRGHLHDTYTAPNWHKLPPHQRHCN